MAITINADTSNGLVMTPDTSGQINFQSAGATITSITANGMAVDTNTLYVDATNNRVGIGTTSPNSTTEIVGRLALTNGGGASRYALNIESNNSGVGYTAINAYNYATSSGTNLVLNESSGNVLINTTATIGGGQIACFFDGSTKNGLNLKTTWGSNGSQFIGFYNSSANQAGYISQNGTTTVQYVTSSDYRLKENVVSMTGALDKISKLKPVTYTWKGTNGEIGEGFIAHELQEICPLAVSGQKDAVDAEGNPKYQGVDTSFLVATLVKAIQEQQETIKDLETRIQALENV